MSASCSLVPASNSSMILPTTSPDLSNSNVDVLVEQLKLGYDAITQPIVKSEFFSTFTPARGNCHQQAYEQGSSNYEPNITADIATLAYVRQTIQDKLRVLPMYLRTQNYVVGQLTERADFANASAISQQPPRVDTVTRNTVGLLQWPLLESMTLYIAIAASVFALIFIVLVFLLVTWKPTSSFATTAGQQFDLKF